MDVTHLEDLEQQQAALAEVQLNDFRSSNLFRLVAARVVPGGSVVDIGCGGGGLVSWLVERGHDARGVDTSAATIDAARHFLERRGQDPARVEVATAGDLLSRGVRADTVVSMDCLEHVEDDAALFGELVELVEPGGRLVVTVPALMALYGERDRLVGHHRRYGRDQLAALCGDAPLKIEELRFWNLLGVGPTYVSHRLLRRNVYESFRYGEPTLRKRLMRSALNQWFRRVENRIRPPVGLTLLLVATRAR